MLLNPLVTPLVRNVAGALLTGAIGGRPKKTGLFGGLTKGLSLPTLMLVGFIAGYGYKTFADPEVHEAAPEVVRHPGEFAWQLYFSPNGGCTDAVVRELNAARQDVKVMAYSFTSKPIAQALVDCFRRGLKVEIILDKGQRGEHYSEADFVANAGIPTYIDARHAIHHNKVICIDGQTVITGSFNFTSNAEKNNAENMLVLRDAEMNARYRHEWQRHQLHSERYTGRGGPGPANGAPAHGGARSKADQKTEPNLQPWRPARYRR